jgi:hypothetical protein
MPERIATATISGVESETLEIDDTYPGTYGFYVRLSRDPGPEWAAEFQAVYDTTRYPAKPPVEFRGDTLAVFYLPRYASDLPEYLRLLEQIVTETNRAVEKRNSVLPDEEKQKQAFRDCLRKAAQDFLRRG